MNKLFKNPKLFGPTVYSYNIFKRSSRHGRYNKPKKLKYFKNGIDATSREFFNKLRNKFNDAKQSIESNGRYKIAAILFFTYVTYKGIQFWMVQLERRANERRRNELILKEIAITKILESFQENVPESKEVPTLQHNETPKVISLGFGKDGSTFNTEINVTSTFNDICGCDGAKKEMEDLVFFLKNPEKFADIGATLPKGVILVGSPGVGKTSLARAVAGEAKVPFIAANSSAFEEIYVGEGASRIRNLFATAKKMAPCVIFLDEIDSLGQKRNENLQRMTYNQTLTQLLVELDGFKPSDGIVVLAATNNQKMLDPALIRPGRFDLQIDIPVPNFEGRKDLFRLYLNKVKTDDNIDIDQLAHGTQGCTGASIRNMINMAAISTVLKSEAKVTMDELWKARDRVLMGQPGKKIEDQDINRVTAVHEAGHALTSYLTAGSSVLHKVTIIPHNNSLGHTSFLDEKEQYNLTKTQLLAKIDTLLGGRIAEELMCGKNDITTGASDDLMKATSIARSMVEKFGMSENLAPLSYDNEPRYFGDSQVLSANTKRVIDDEVERIILDCYDRVSKLLQSHKADLQRLVDALLKNDTLSKAEVTQILSGNSIKRND